MTTVATTLRPRRRRPGLLGGCHPRPCHLAPQLSRCDYPLRTATPPSCPAAGIGPRPRAPGQPCRSWLQAASRPPGICRKITRRSLVTKKSMIRASRAAEKSCPATRARNVRGVAPGLSTTSSAPTRPPGTARRPPGRAGAGRRPTAPRSTATATAAGHLPVIDHVHVDDRRGARLGSTAAGLPTRRAAGGGGGRAAARSTTRRRQHLRGPGPPRSPVPRRSHRQGGGAPRRPRRSRRSRQPGSSRPPASPSSSPSAPRARRCRPRPPPAARSPPPSPPARGWRHRRRCRAETVNRSARAAGRFALPAAPGIAAAGTSTSGRAGPRTASARAARVRAERSASDSSE